MYKKDPLKSKIRHRKWHLASKYEMSGSDYDEILSRQSGKCKICGTIDPGGGKSRFMIDHSHNTNLVRGLLCHHCNLLLGMARDDARILLAAISYLSDPTD